MDGSNSAYRSVKTHHLYIYSALVVRPRSSSNIRQESNTRLTMWMVTTRMTPNEGMSMLIPIGSGFLHGLPDFIPGLETSSLEGQRAQDFPPGFNQVEIGRVFGLEDEFPTRMGQAEQQDISSAMGAQIINDAINSLNIS